MAKEQSVLLLMWIASVLLLCMIGRRRVRATVFLILIFQSMTWLISLMLSSLSLFEFPVRELPRATSINFTFEFILFPAYSVWFHYTYPERRSTVRQIGHYALFATIFVAFYSFVAQFTSLVKFHASPFWLYLTFPVALYITRRVFLWFVREEPGKSLAGLSEKRL
ncbi:CBO0543 family protein [Paenibacillus oleatilyticus]|uniref:CBO0543 family protein n=1 Tax=Paenibacillus oleatilyticus TaxID=2594886 RepID=A0ABV4V9K2_9BACL